MRAVDPTVGLLLAVTLLGAPVAARGQGTEDANGERTYGTASSVSHTIGATAFQLFAPVTRAQMAKFISQALGLQFAP